MEKLIINLYRVEELNGEHYGYEVIVGPSSNYESDEGVVLFKDLKTLVKIVKSRTKTFFYYHTGGRAQIVLETPSSIGCVNSIKNINCKTLSKREQRKFWELFDQEIES